MEEKLKNYLTELGNRIKIRRIELGMSQEELAIKCGYKSRSTINKIELGINDVPQSKIRAIADALHTTPSYIMGWVDMKEQQTFYEILEDSEAEEYFNEKVNQLEETKTKEAMLLYEQYKNADPKIQAAINALLKPTE